MQLIERVELTSTAASITFSNIPQDGTDLLVVHSTRTNRNLVWDWLQMTFNGSSTGYSSRQLKGDGSVAQSDAPSPSNFFLISFTSGNTATSNTFGNSQIYISNYTSSVAKSLSSDTVSESNGTESYQQLVAGLWTGTQAITSIVIAPYIGTAFLSGSSFTLYKITKGSDGTTTVS